MAVIADTIDVELMPLRYEAIAQAGALAVIAFAIYAAIIFTISHINPGLFSGGFAVFIIALCAIGLACIIYCMGKAVYRMTDIPNATRLHLLSVPPGYSHYLDRIRREYPDLSILRLGDSDLVLKQIRGIDIPISETEVIKNEE